MTKKKSIWAFVLAFMLVMPAMFLLSACGKHEHSFSSEWSKSETQHWHACTDKNCNEKQDLADHEFVWAEKTPAGVHTDKVETGTCSTCQYQKDRTVEGSGANIHSWEWIKTETEHLEKTTCTQHAPIERNKGPHTYTDKNDVDCNDCGYVRSLTGKGSFNKTFLTKTYNAGAQGIDSNEYKVDEAIKDLCEIQYKVKGADGSTYTTAPVDAGTYEVRIYCRGNDTYLQGEVAKAEAEFVINKYAVDLTRNVTFKVAYNKAAMEDANVEYIHLGTVSVTNGLVQSVDVPIKVLKTNSNKNPGRIQINYSSLSTDDNNFKIKQYSGITKVTLIHYNDSVVATLTSGAAESVEWDTTTEQVGITVTSVNNGTIRVGDYMICEGYSRPLEVVALKLPSNALTDMLVNGDSNCKVYFDYSSFADLATAKPILANKTFTEVETLNFVAGKNYTNTVSRQLNKGESFYLVFTTEASANLKTYKLNFNTNGTGYVTTSESVVFYREDGSGVSGGYELNVKTPDGVLYFVKVTKTADSEAGKESVDFNITKR